MNLSGNKISELSFGAVLATCPNLTNICLSRNPIDRIPQYSTVVPYMIPSLKILDNSPINKAIVSKATNALYVEAMNALKLVEEELDDEDRLENEIYQDIMPMTDFIRGSANTNSGKASSTSTGSASNSMDLLPDTGSELTHGSAVVLAGNMAAAMRKRRQQQEFAETGTEQPNTPYRPKTAGGNNPAEAGKEFESALDVLDLALIGKVDDAPYTFASANSKVPTSSFVKEGDITDAVLGRISPIKASTRPTLEIPLESTMSPTLHSSKNPNTGRGKAPSLDYDTINSTNLVSASRRPKSAFSGSILRFSGNVDNDVAGNNSVLPNTSKPSTPDSKRIVAGKKKIFFVVFKSLDKLFLLCFRC